MTSKLAAVLGIAGISGCALPIAIKLGLVAAGLGGIVVGAMFATGNGAQVEQCAKPTLADEATAASDLASEKFTTAGLESLAASYGLPVAICIAKAAIHDFGDPADAGVVFSGIWLDGGTVPLIHPERMASRLAVWRGLMALRDAGT